MAIKIPGQSFREANFLGHLIFGLVDATVCKGKILMKNKIIALDEERIAARSRELSPQMWKRL